MKMNREVLEENIYYYPDAIKDPQKLVEIIEKTDLGDYGSSIGKWSNWDSCSGQMYNYGTEKILYPTEEEMSKSAEDNDISYIFHVINDAFYNVCKDYAVSKGDMDEPNYYPVFPIKKYKAGTFMGAHFDQQEGDKRLRYSLVMYLNDDYEGGELSFTIKSPDAPIIEGKPDEDFDIAKEKTPELLTVSFKPKAGSVVIFPSSPPYHHTAHLVKSGAKYMVPTHWMHEGVAAPNKSM